MTSRHYRWQTRWRVDLAARTAAHDCGLIVRLVGTPRGPGAEPVNAAAIELELAKTHGGHNAPRMVVRMLREARQLHAEALAGGAHHG